MKLILYHGTSEENAKKIEKEGFVTDTKYNWNIKSKKGFVYLSSAYAPFYCMKSTKGDKFALVKVEVDSDDCYPEDDFLMIIIKNQKVKTPKDMKLSVSYTQEELDKVNMEDWKHFWINSLHYLGNVAVRPEKIEVLGVRYFDGENLVFKCDPVICPTNFVIMGDYYKKLTEWIFEGKDFRDFKSDVEMIIEKNGENK
jgi:diacylglycerol kinase family enzyme